MMVDKPRFDYSAALSKADAEMVGISFGFGQTQFMYGAARSRQESSMSQDQGRSWINWDAGADWPRQSN